MLRVKVSGVDDDVEIQVDGDFHGSGQLFKAEEPPDPSNVARVSQGENNSAVPRQGFQVHGTGNGHHGLFRLVVSADNNRYRTSRSSICQTC
jgi:hypothetical protein